MISNIVSTKRGRSGKFRPEIEGLRTVAFFLVAVFHIWLNRVSGGVDVFFTVAGLLVTLTLLSHVRRYGRIRPGIYFGRLAMRLLPAAAVVLAAVILLTLLTLPYAMWRDIFTQTVASSTYWENWYLAFNAVDYLAVDTTRSPLQHFWAMSIQGQFYIIWFVVFATVAWGAQRVGRNVKSAVFIAVSCLVLVSFAWSVYQTATNQQFAYFSTFTRVWEFGVGSLAAMLIDRIKLNSVVAAILSWCALSSIILVGALLPVFDLFPGWVALIPVLAACVIVAAGQQEEPWGASALLASKPMVWLGGLGYGVYLWHWPMLIYALEVQGRQKAGPLTGTAIIIGAVVLAWLTKKLVEDPFQRARSSVRRRVRMSAIAIATASAILVAGGATAGIGAIDQRTTAEAELLADPCIGANALSIDAACENADLGDIVLPSDPDRDAGDLFLGTDIDGNRCATAMTEDELLPCTWGNPDSETRIALIGNSHAAVWFPAYREIADRYGWRLDTYFKHACTYNDASRRQKLPIRQETCDRWNKSLSAHLTEQKPYDYILTSALAQNDGFFDADSTSESTGFAVGVEGYKRVWQPLIDRGTTLLVMRDYPRSSPGKISCAREDPNADCSRTVDGATVPRDAEAIAVAADATEGAEVIDMTDWFCTDGSCPSVIGNVFVYRDPGHFTATYGFTLADALQQELQTQADFPPPPGK